MKGIAVIKLFLFIGISICSQEFYVTILGGSADARTNAKALKIGLKDNELKYNIQVSATVNEGYNQKQETVNVNEKESAYHQVIVPPTPSTNLFQIKGEWFLTRYEIYNVVGKLIKGDRIHGNEISVDHLKTGIYIIKLFQGNENIFTSRIIKK